MKKVLGLGLIAIAFASCSDDDGGSSVNMDQLTKKWYPQSYVLAGVTIPFEQDEDACGNDYFEFKSDGTYVEYDVYDCADSSPVAWTDTYAYTVSGHTVTIDYGDGDTETGTVTELSSSTLKVEIAYDMDDDGTAETTVTEVYKSTPQ